jgi:hypothetical protein
MPQDEVMSGFYGNETSGSIRGREFLNQMRGYKILL